ncbi:MAG TPA: phosphoribosylaminoimidazolesuccinocarboxamide synthase [Polyangiales bacterium]|nr:phosphoribosylaminoimidazolesuccinocarboxamide synthase [Polyangiales bacterium]
MDIETLRKGLNVTLDRTDIQGLGQKYQGKVRDNYTTADGRRFIVVTDRISAFDRVLGTLPFKGQVLNSLAAFWFDETRELVPNHMLSSPDPNAMECVECKPLPVEFVVRAYLTGVSSTSILTAYKQGAREFCGHRLPEGLSAHEALPKPLVTPTTKAPQGEHDENVSREEIIARKMLSAELFDEAAGYALMLFAHGQRVCAERGLILVDTKYEFGIDPQGRVVLIDEIHTPDSSRFWFAKSYSERMSQGKSPESFDKEYVRRWLSDQGYKGDGPSPTLPDDVRVEAARRYIEACETIRGEPFRPDLNPPQERLAKNLLARAKR